jgi:hypothetical protein
MSKENFGHFGTWIIIVAGLLCWAINIVVITLT